MGNLVRRVLAFVLGMVFTVSLAAGSVAGGAYWAYKTVKPLTAVTDKDSGLGDLREQTVEDLVALLQSATAEPDKYTLARLADEYNIDFVKLLDKVGVKVDADKNKANWNALMGVSLFNLKDGIEPFLKSIPVRALYNFISEEQLDNLLSREAQDKLGDYTVYELISKEEGETDVGAIKAVRTLSIGSLLPQFFEEKYDAATHRSEYVLKDDCKIRVLEVFGNVSLGVISNMLAPGADFMTELLEGSLSSVAEMPIEDIIYDIAATISEDIGKEVKKYAAVLNGAKISQLFTRNADGGYSFTYESVVKDLKIGCIFGLTDELGDGVWTNKNGEPVPDVLQELCNIDLGAIFDNDGTLDMINQLIGGVNVGMILDACKVEVGTPALDMIRKIEIGKLLEGQTDKFDVNKFLQSLVSNVRESVGDVTLSEIIGVTTGNAFVDKLLSFKVSDFVLDEYSVKNILNALKSGFGDVCLGDVLNVTKGEGGEWNITGTAFEKLEFMKPLFDLSINNIINVVDEITSNNGKVTASAIVETIIPELKLGDIFVAIPGISKDEATGNYVITAGNISKVLPSGIGALLDMRVYQIVDGIENNNSQFDLYTILDNVKFGDFVSFADDLLNKGEKEYVYDEKSEKYVWKNDAASSTTRFMNVSVAEMVNDAFKNKFEKTLSTPVIAVTEFAAEMGKWVSRVSGLDKTLTEIDSQLDSLCGIVSGIFTPESTLKKATVADDVEAGVIVDGVRIILDTVNSFKTSSGKKIIPNAVYSAIDGVDEIIGNIKLKNFVEEIKTVEVSKVISVAASSVNDATENKYEEKVNAFAGVADTIAGGTLGNFRIRNFLVASAEGSAEQGLAEQIHNILIIYKANNSSVDEMFVQLSEIYGGVRAKEFLDKNKNLEINQSVSAIASVVKTFFKDDANGTKVKDIIDGGVNVVEVVFRGKTFVKFGVADFDVSELTEKTETLSGLILGSSSQANKTICSVLGEFKTLYNGVKVSKFVEFSKNMPLENVINASTRIAKTAVADYSNGANTDKANDALDDVAALVNCVFEGSTLGKVKVAEDKRVVELTDKVEALTDNFLKDGTAAKNIVAKVYDEIEILYPTSTFNTIVNDSKNMLLANVVNAATDIIKTALTECKVKNAEKINDCITDFADLVNYTLEGSTLTHINIYADKQIVEFVNKVEAITDNFLKDGSKERTVVAEFYNEVKALYAATTLKTFVADSKNMLIADVVNAATGIVKTALTTYNVKNADKINDCITDFVELVNYTLEGSTLTHINIYADKQIVVFVDKVEAITDNFLKEGSKEKTVVAKVYDEVRILYPATTLKSFVADSKNMLLANVTNAVADISKTAVTTYNVKDSAKINDTITDSVDMINYIFEGSTLSKIKVTNDKTVVELTNKTEAITDNFLKEGSKEKTVVAKVYDEVRILYPTTTIKTFVDDSKNMLLANVTNAVADISKTAVTTYNVKDSAKINDTITDSVDMINYIFEGSTLSKIKVTNDKTVVELTNKTEAITDNFLKEGSKEKTVVAKVYDEVRILYPTTTLKSFVTDSKNMLLANVTNAVADITTTAVTTYNVKDSAKINNTITDSVDMINYIFEGSTLSKIKVTNDKTVVELTNKTEAITDNFLKEGSKEKTVVSKVYDEVRILYPTTTLKSFVTDSKNMLLANVTNAVADITTTAVTTYNVKDSAKINDTITDSVDMINYIFEGSTLSKIKVTNDKTVVELTNKTEAITDNFLKEGSKEKTVVAKVYDEVRNLYPTTTIKTFVDDSKNMLLANVTNAVADISKTAVTTYNVKNATKINDTITDSVDMINYIFEGSTLSKIKVTNDKTVVELTNKTEAITDNLLKEGSKEKTVVAKVYDEVRILYPATTLKSFVADSKNMLLANVTNAVADISKTAITTYNVKDSAKINDTITDSVDMINYIFEGSTLSKIKVTNDKTVVELTNKTEAITDNFLKEGSKEKTVVAKVYDEVRILYPTTTIKTFVDDSKNMLLANVTNAVADISKTAVTTYNVKDSAKINDTITDSVDMINYIFEGSTLSKIKVTNDKTVVELTNKTEAITDNFLKEGSKEKTVVAKVYDEVRNLYPTTTIKTFVDDSKKLIIADVTVAVGEIVKVSVNKQKASDITDAVNDIVKVVFGTKTITDSKPIVNFEVAKLSNEVKDLADIVITNNKAKTIIDEVAAQFASLYAGVVRSEFVTASGELQIADIVDSVDSIIKTCVTVSGNKDEVKINDGIDDLADLAKTLFGGTVKKPVIYNITVSDAADRAEAITDDIPMNTRLRETIACVYEKVRSLYAGKKLTEVGSASKSLEFNAVVSAVSDITVTAAKNNVVTDVFDGVKGISSKLFTGTMSSVKIADFFIDELTDEVIAAADKAIGAGVPKDMLDETAAQFAYLFNGTRRSGFITAAKNVDFGDLLHSVSEIAKKASTNSKYLSAVTDTVALACELVSGKVTAPKFADFEITGLANAVNAFVTDFVPDGKVKDVISKTIENFGDLYAGGTTRTTFVADSKNLSIGDTITSVKEITDVAGVKLDRVYTLATVAIGGNDEHASTFAKPYFDMNGLWNEANTTEKIVGVGVGAAVGAGMYFLANDTLVKLAKNALGEDKLVGDLVAETLGYTKNESGKWTFEDDENELATTAFELRVCDVLKKGFDFKGTFEEKLNVANVALLGKAVNTKYDKKDNVKNIVNGALDEIVNLFGTADAKNYKEVIKAVKVDAVVDSLAAIAGIPSSGKYADKADHIAALLKEMLAGTLGKPGIESNMFIAPVVRGVKDVAADYIPDGKVKDIVSVTLENFASLYEYDLAGSTEKASYTFKRIKEGTKAIEIKKLIASGSDIVKTASSAVYGKTERWFDIAGQILAGTVSDPEVYIDKAWKGLSNKEKLVVAGVGGTTAFVAYNYFNDKFVSYLEKHYGDRTVGSLIADNLGYAQNAGGEYVLSAYGFVNPMMNEYFAEKIVTVANKTYDYKQPLREYLTVGNLIAASGQTMHVYTKFAPASFKLAQEGGKWTIEGDKYKTVAANVLAIAAFKDGKRLDARVKDDVKAFIGNEILANVRVGELMGKAKDGTGWLESAGVYASGMSSAVYDIDAGKFVKGETTVDDVVNGLTVGDVMTITNQSSGLLQRLKPVKVGDLAGRIDNLRLGEAMSYVRVEDGGTVKWYEAEKDAEGNYVIAEADFVAGTTEVTDEVVLAIADFTVKELSDGGFSDKLMNAVKDITLGKVISVGNNKILKQLENVKIGSISTEINHMSVSKLLGYEKGTDGKWYETDENGNIDNSKEVTGVVTAFVDFTIEDLGSADFGTRIKAKVNDLTLGDIIAHDDNPILAALADKKIGTIADDANELRVGVIMGYTYDETTGIWYKDAAKTAPVTDDLMLMLAKYQVKDLNSGDFESRVTADIKQLKVSKFFGSYEANANTIFGILSESDYNNATIDSLPALMQRSMTTAKLGKLGELGIVSLDENRISAGEETISIRTALNTIFDEKETSGEYKWENWNMSDLLTNLVQKAFDAAGRR